MKKESFDDSIHFNAPDSDLGHSLAVAEAHAVLNAQTQGIIYYVTTSSNAT